MPQRHVGGGGKAPDIVTFWDVIHDLVHSGQRFNESCSLHIQGNDDGALQK